MSSTASSSSVCLISNVHSKDYASTLASLQSSYGANGQAPMQPISKATPAYRRSMESRLAPSTAPSSSSSEKDWEAALAHLQSQFGANGGAPCRPPVKTKSKTSSATEKAPSEKPKKSQRKFGFGWSPLGHSQRSSL